MAYEDKDIGSTPSVSIDTLGRINRYQFGKLGLLLAWSDGIVKHTRIAKGEVETFAQIHGLNPALSLTSTWSMPKAEYGDKNRDTLVFKTAIEAPESIETLPQAETLFDALRTNLTKMDLQQSIFSNFRIVIADYDGESHYLANLARYDKQVTVTNKTGVLFGAARPGYGPSFTFQPTPLDRINDEWGSQVNYIARHLAFGVLTLVTLTELISGKTVPDLDIAVSKDGTFIYDDDSRTIMPINGRYDLTTGKHDRPAAGDDKPSSAETISVRPDKSPEFDISKDKVELSDFAGLEHITSQLRDVANSFNHPEILEKYRAKRPSGILLAGPAGTGKTMLAEGLATEIGGELWEIKVSELIDKWLGNSQKNMQKIFDKAKNVTKPTVMLWDEIDAMLGEGDGKSSAAREINSMVGVFKSEMTKLADENPNIIVAATTNDADLLDDAVIRAGRFDLKLTVPLPVEAARLQIWNNKISEDIADSATDLSPADFSEAPTNERPADFRLYDDTVNIQELARMSDGMSGADIVECLRRAKFKCAMAEIRTGTPQHITQELLVELVRTYYR